MECVTLYIIWIDRNPSMWVRLLKIDSCINGYNNYDETGNASLCWAHGFVGGMQLHTHTTPWSCIMIFHHIKVLIRFGQSHAYLGLVKLVRYQPLGFQCLYYCSTSYMPSHWLHQFNELLLIWIIFDRTKQNFNHASDSHADLCQLQRNTSDLCIGIATPCKKQ